MSVTVHINGPNASALASELETFFAEALTIKVERAPIPTDEAIQRSDPVAVAALVLAIPGAILATLDLAARARLGERIDQLLTRLRGKAAAADSVQLTNGEGAGLDLITANRDAVLDELEQDLRNDSSEP